VRCYLDTGEKEERRGRDGCTQGYRCRFWRELMGYWWLRGGGGDGRRGFGFWRGRTYV